MRFKIGRTVGPSFDELWWFELVAFGCVGIGLEERRNGLVGGGEGRIIIFAVRIVKLWVVVEEGRLVVARTGEVRVH